MPTNPRYVSNGSYGCVMRPSVPCNLKKEGAVDTVSKIFYNFKDAKEEQESNKQVRQLDPKNKFTIKDLASCKVRSKAFPEIEFCNWDHYPAEVQQIIYEFGGMTLDAAFSKYHPVALFAHMLPLFEGLVTLSEKGMVHADIKPVNILFNVNTRKVVYIDFGMLTKPEGVFNGNIVLQAVYPYYPPEFVMFSGGDPLQNYKMLFQNKNFIRAIKNKMSAAWLEDFVLTLTNYNFEHHIFDPLKVDVFSLGVTLLICIGMSKNTLSLALQKNVGKLISSMIHPDPSVRFTAKEAHDDFVRLIEGCRLKKRRSLTSGRCVAEPKDNSIKNSS